MALQTFFITQRIILNQVQKNLFDNEESENFTSGMASLFLMGRKAKNWRRMRDSNPRYPYEYNGFQDRRLQPLGQSSAEQKQMGRSFASYPYESTVFTTATCNHLSQPTVKRLGSSIALVKVK